MDIIKSKENKKIKYYKSLLKKKNRIKAKEYLVEGFHLCQMAQEAGCLKEIILTPETNFNFNKKIFVDSLIIKLLSNSVTSQPIIGVVKMNDKEMDATSNYIILDNIQEPGNLGAILRSALAFGYKNVLLSENTVDLFNSKTLRSAQGANFKLNINKVNLEEKLKKLDLIKIATTLGSDAIPLKDFSLKNTAHAIVVGNEGNGIRPEIIKLCDKKLYINIQEINSLNVVVAMSIVAYKLNNN